MRGRYDYDDDPTWEETDAATEERREERMDALDTMIDELVGTAAEVVNRSGRQKPTTATACPVAEAPVALLRKLKAAVEKFRGGEYGTTETVRHACDRTWE